MPDTSYYIAINRKIKRAFIVLTIVFFLILVGFALAARANTHRVDEIQESRIKSCQTTYDGIREVFKPFFPDPPRTPEQIQNLETFNNTIDRLRRQCVVQTKPGGSD